MAERLLSGRERNALMHIIVNRYDFMDGGDRGMRIFIQEAGLSQLVPALQLEGSPYVVARDLIRQLECSGLLREEPRFHGLGKLISELLSMSDVKSDDKKFLASLVLKYHLVEDPAYLNELRYQFGLME